MLSVANTTAPTNNETGQPAQANNIIIFPKAYIVPPIEQLNNTLSNEKFMEMHIDLIADNVMEYLIMSAQENSIPLTGNSKDVLLNQTLMLNLEAIKATLMCVYSMHHPLHPVCAELFPNITDEQT